MLTPRVSRLVGSKGSFAASISGVGAAKLERYGEAFIAVIAAHKGEADVPAA